MIGEQFSPEEQINLTMMIVVINGFNRIGVGFRVSHPAQAGRPPDGRRRRSRLRSLASAADPHRLSHAGLGRGRGGWVQEAFLRWLASDRAASRKPGCAKW